MGFLGWLTGTDTADVDDDLDLDAEDEDEDGDGDDYLTADEAEAMYRESLDQTGPVRIGGNDYEVSRALKAIDAAAYHVGFRDYRSGLAEKGYFIEGYNA